ncbi:N-acetyllactosaminide beta-1,3-N-acetylglucosaminyltransferase 2-like [Arapaima gigas]
MGSGTALCARPYALRPHRGVADSEQLAAHPANPFWNLQLDNRALWNHLQHLLDRENNPLLWKPSTTEGAADAWNSTGGSVSGRAHLGCGSPGLASHLAGNENFSQQIRDFILSMHCRDYSLLMDQPSLCGHDGQEAPFLLVAVKSQECNFENRQAIRRTVFLLGQQDRSKQPCSRGVDLLKQESDVYGDILQWGFQDTFFNLTLKDVLFWAWFSRRCPHAHFVFKGDDDVFVQTPALLEYLRREEKWLDRRGKSWDFFVGELIDNATPVRSAAEKYYVPESFYVGQYPPYASGGGIIYSGSLALRLLEVSKQVHLFPIDDVYLGMCLRKLGLAPTHHPGFLIFDFPEKDKGNSCAYYSILLVHKRSPTEMQRLWKKLQAPPPECINQTVSAKSAEMPEQPEESISDRPV